MSFLGFTKSGGLLSFIHPSGDCRIMNIAGKNFSVVLAKKRIFPTVDQARMLPNLERYSEACIQFPLLNLLQS